MGLSSSCLAVCKDCPVVTLKNILDDVGGTQRVDIRLLRIPVEAVIEGELLGGFVRVRFVHKNLSSFVVQLDDDFMASSHFALTEGSAPDSHFDTLCLCGVLVFLAHFEFEYLL